MPVKKMKASKYVNKAMKEYGEFVIEDRAVPDVRDGLKPVLRRILWSMHKQGFKHAGNFKKSARVVGDVVGKYHPHSDASIYSTMAGMAQEFNVRYPLIEGHGNFGSPIDSQIAASRYTEARMTKLAAKVFECIDIADLKDNYDGDTKEPVVLPSRVPLLLMNGSIGIGVGMSTAIPPHNLKELVKALRYLIKCRVNDKEADVEKVLKAVQGPDYACGGYLISSPEEIAKVYQNGEGSLKYRCKYEFEQGRGHGLLVITEFAPGFYYEPFTRMIQTKFVDTGKALFLADESSKKLRIVIGFENPVVVEELKKHLQTSVSYRFYVLRGRELQFSDLMGMLEEYIDFQVDIETKMLKLELVKLHIKLSREEARLIVIQNWKTFMEILEKSKTKEGTLDKLQKRISLTQEQAEYILTVPVGNLARYNIQELKERIKDLKDQIAAVRRQLEDIYTVLLDRLDQLRPFLDERRTRVEDEDNPDMDVELGEKWIGITEKGKLGVWQKPPTNEAGFDFIVSANDFVTVVDEHGNAFRMNVSSIKRGKSGIRNKVVGLIPGKCHKLIAIEEKTGKCVALDHPQKVPQYQVMNTEQGISVAFGLSEGDKVVAFHEEEVATIPFVKIATTRKGVKSRRLIKGRRRYTTLLIPRNAIVVDEEGTKVSDGDIPFTRTFVLTTSNLCRKKDGKHLPRSMNQLIREMQLDKWAYTKIFNL